MRHRAWPIRWPSPPSPSWPVPTQAANGSLILSDGQGRSARRLIGQSLQRPQAFLGPALGDFTDALQRRQSSGGLEPGAVESGAPGRRRQGADRSPASRRPGQHAAPVPVDLVTAHRPAGSTRTSAAPRPTIKPPALRRLRVRCPRPDPERSRRSATPRACWLGVIGESRVNVLRAESGAGPAARAVITRASSGAECEDEAMNDLPSRPRRAAAARAGRRGPKAQARAG